jgi:UDP-glucose:(heptosyl)LPS alpha-1,3-glucosyltransferase
MLPIRGPCHLYHPHAGLAAESLSSAHLKYPHPLKRLLSASFNRLNRKRNEFARVEREMLSSPAGPTVLCLSDHVKQTVRRHYPALPESRLATLFNAVDLRRFDPAKDPSAGKSLRQQFSIPNDRILALIIAQDFARKGLRECILAIQDLPSVTLLVVGRDNPAPYQRLTQQLGLSDRVLFAGPTADPYPFYQAADLFLLPTRHDPCSLVVLESLAMGLPVISTTSNGACEIMTDGLHGRILPNPADILALTTAIRHLLDEQTRRVAKEACLTLRPHLSFDHHVDQLLQIYRQSSPPPVLHPPS